MQLDRTIGLLRKRLLLLINVLIMALSACAPFDSVNPLTKSLTPTSPTEVVTPKELSEEDIIAPTPSGRSLQPQLGEADIDLNEVKVLLPPDAIPAILPDKAREIMVTVAEADAKGISGDVRVIGVSIDGDSRAYPIPYLSAHEIVNDKVGDQLIAATW